MFLYLQVLRTRFPDAVMSNDIREVAALPKVMLGPASQYATVQTQAATYLSRDLSPGTTDASLLKISSCCAWAHP